MNRMLANHFKSCDMVRLGVEDLNFNLLSASASDELIKPIFEDGIKNEVWDRDSYTSSAPDGINLRFIKEFLVEIKSNVIQFLSKFQRNGKLTRGLNCTFIMLNTKVEKPQRLNEFRPISLVACF